MDNRLEIGVQMQYLRPRQLEGALRRFPVVYVPFGLIEWHGRHLPLGNDGMVQMRVTAEGRCSHKQADSCR
jgi:creatinine amidohydrolase/Fe(II)-dependent formamide hydrolase-like protein